MEQIQEYKRKCNECGNVWHSLVSREAEISRSISKHKFAACAACGDMGAMSQAERNEDAQTDVLTKLKKCPNCSSQNYEETIISYEKKP